MQIEWRLGKMRWTKSTLKAQEMQNNKQDESSQF